MNPIEIDEVPVETDTDAEPLITELDIRVIAANLHDQGRGCVLPDMIEGVTDDRPLNEDFSPRKLQIRNPEWRKARQKAERQKYRAKRRTRMTNEEKAKQLGNLQLWKADNPDKMQAAKARRLKNRKAANHSREFVAVDLEGFNTGRYFTDDRPDYARQFHENMAQDIYHTGTEDQQKALDHLLRHHVMISDEEKLEQQLPFAGWTVHDRKWYLDQHDLTDGPIPSARNKKFGAPPIYVEHRPFLFGAGNDREQYFLTEEGETFLQADCTQSETGNPQSGRGEWTDAGNTARTKRPLSGVTILNAIFVNFRVRL